MGSSLRDPGRATNEATDRGRPCPDDGPAWPGRRPTSAPLRPDQVARRGKVRVIPVGASPPRLTQSLQPEAIGAAAEVTKPPKPPRQRAALAVRRAGRP